MFSTWRTAYAATVSGSANSTILCIGDSLTAGCASTGNQMGGNARSASWPAVMAGLFQSCHASNAGWFGDANSVVAGADPTLYDYRFTSSDGWDLASDNVTVGHNAISQKNGMLSALAFTPGVEFDRIRIYYACWSGSPEYTVNIGGSTLTTLNMDQGAYSGGAFEDISCTLGTNPVNIVATGNFGVINGAYVYKSSVKQVTIINGGWWGVTAAEYASDANGYQPLATIAVINPDLTIIMLGVNDCLAAVAENTLKTNLRAIVDAAKAVGDVLMVAFTRVNPTSVSEATQTTYIQYIKDVAIEKGVAFFDPTTRANWASYSAANAAGFKDADGIHNTGAGYADLAQAIWELIETQSAAPSADVTDGAWTPSAGTDLYATLDEAVPSDTDYATVSSASTFEVELGTFEDPGTLTGFVCRYRLSASSGGFVVTVRQGTTTIASWTHGTAPTSPTTFEQYLTTAQVATISFPATLKLQIEST